MNPGLRIFSAIVAPAAILTVPNRVFSQTTGNCVRLQPSQATIGSKPNFLSTSDRLYDTLNDFYRNQNKFRKEVQYQTTLQKLQLNNGQNIRGNFTILFHGFQNSSKDNFERIKSSFLNDLQTIPEPIAKQYFQNGVVILSGLPIEPGKANAMNTLYLDPWASIFKVARFEGQLRQKGIGYRGAQTDEALDRIRFKDPRVRQLPTEESELLNTLTSAIMANYFIDPPADPNRSFLEQIASYDPVKNYAERNGTQRLAGQLNLLFDVYGRTGVLPQELSSFKALVNQGQLCLY